MLSEKAVSAKKVLEFYMEKLHSDESGESVFAAQFANLHMLKYRIQCSLDTLESYEIETK